MTLQDVLCQAADLPSFPEIALRVARETEHADACAASISTLMSEDQGLSSRVLRLANSSFFGVPRRIDSLREAIIVLGLVNVRRLALAASTYSWFVSSGRGSKLPMALLTQGMTAASLATDLERTAAAKSETDLFTASIVADIGLAALSAVQPNLVQEVLSMCRDEQMPLNMAEVRVFGFSHAEVGAAMAHEWGFPDGVIRVIRDYSDPGRAADYVVDLDFVNVAMSLCNDLNIGLRTLGVLQPLQPEAILRLGLARDEVEAVRDGLANQGKQAVGQLWGMAA